MKHFILFFGLTLIISCTFAQRNRRTSTEFIYGRMIKPTDTLVGFFRFDFVVSQNGQTVYFKRGLNEKKTKRFQTRRYDYFESDSVYLENFAVPMSGVLGKVEIMIPRVLNGKIQLFEYRLRTPGLFKDIETERFFVKKGDVKMRLNRRKFKEQMLQLIGDKPEIMGKIDTEQLKYADLMDIIFQYNNDIILPSKRLFSRITGAPELSL